MKEKEIDVREELMKLLIPLTDYAFDKDSPSMNISLFGLGIDSLDSLRAFAWSISEKFNVKIKVDVDDTPNNIIEKIESAKSASK
ncbi:MAG: hypothetical protein ACM3UU_12075 [Ignavibacteriales bacterium]